jgi:hypothetical protein
MTCTCFIAGVLRIDAMIPCGRPAQFGYRWGSDAPGVCCLSCKESLEAGAVRMRRSFYTWPLRLPQTGDAR